MIESNAVESGNNLFRFDDLRGAIPRGLTSIYNTAEATRIALTDPPISSTVPHSVLLSGVFLVVFAAAVGLLMMLNTMLLGLGDPKFGRSGWGIYWPLWFAFYAPSALIFVGQFFRLPLSERGFVSFYLPATVLLLLCVEISFAADLGWPWLLAEVVALAIVSEVLVRSRIGRTSPRFASRSDNSML